MKFAEWITNAENEYAWTHDGDAIIFPAATEALDKLVNNPPEVADDPVFKAAYEEAAKAAVRRSTTLIAALMVRMGDADTLLCGTLGRFDVHLGNIRDVIGARPGTPLATVNAIAMGNRTLFITDTYVNDDPDAETLAKIAVMAAEEVNNFGIPPKVAFVSHSQFGSSRRPSAIKMRQARDIPSILGIIGFRGIADFRNVCGLLGVLGITSFLSTRGALSIRCIR